jgi:diacylglycerol kinase family enzyme
VGNNEYQLSGLELGGRRSLTRGTLQICTAPGMGRWGVAGMITAAVLGRIHTIEEFESFHAMECTLDTGRHRMRVSVDGEVVTMEGPLVYRIRPGALRVIVPADREPARQGED